MYSISTGGPHYLRSFYVGFRLFAIQENVPNLMICGLSLAYLRVFDRIGHETQLKVVFYRYTVLPRY